MVDVNKELRNLISKYSLRVRTMPSFKTDDHRAFVSGDLADMKTLFRLMNRLELNLYPEMYESGAYILQYLVDHKQASHTMPYLIGYTDDGEPFYIEHKGSNILYSGIIQSGKSTAMHSHLEQTLTNPTARVAFVDLAQREFKDASHKIKQRFFKNVSSFEDAAKLFHMVLKEIVRRNEDASSAGTYPPLFIYIDEAWILSEHSKEMMQYISDIARLGPGTGVHLIMSLHVPKADSFSTIARSQCIPITFRQLNQAHYKVSLGDSVSPIYDPKHFYIAWRGIHRLSRPDKQKEEYINDVQQHLGEMDKSIIEYHRSEVLDELADPHDVQKMNAIRDTGLEHYGEVSANKLSVVAKVSKPRARAIVDWGKRRGLFQVDDEGKHITRNQSLVLIEGIFH